MRGGNAARSIEEVLKEYTKRLLSLPGVVGAGIGEHDGKPCIRVMIEKRTKDLSKKIPKALQGYPVVTEETGKIRPLRPE